MTAVSPVPTCAAGVPFLRVLPPTALDELTATMRHRHYDRGQWVAAAGDPVTHLIVVARGRLKAVQATPAGREQVVRTLGPGEFVGELGLFAPARHESDLIAQAPSDVCLVDRAAVQAIIRRHPDAAVRLMAALAERLAAAERTIADLALRDVGKRLAAELARAAASGSRAPDGIRVRMPVSWLETAARLGTTPESLSRRLRGLVEQGIIRQERGRTLVIRDPDRLRELANA